MKNRYPQVCRLLIVGLLTGLLTVTAKTARAQGFGFSDPGGGYGLKIYRVESGLYPFVQVYFRTFDQYKQPLVNLNAMNIGLMVKGRSYDPMKRQYTIQPIRQRPEATRSVLVLDGSQSMEGGPFLASLRAAVRFIDTKRPQDEVAILAIRDTKEGYEVVSQFERDPGVLGRRLADVLADGMKTRLYDAIGAAMQMCGMTAQGAMAPGPESYVASCALVVFSDGRDEGSAISREELMARITNMSVPIPIYSLAYTRQSQDYFKNLEALSKNSFGYYFLIGQAVMEMQRTVEAIQNILQGDYVVTFRSYTPIDGERHALKLGVEYPTGSGKFTYDSADFEALEPPPFPAIQQQKAAIDAQLPALPDNNPYFGPSATTAIPEPGSASF